MINETNLIKIFPLSEKYLYRYSEWWNDDRVCWLLLDTCQCTGRPGSSRQLRLRALRSPAAAAFSARTCSTSPNSCCLLSHIHLYGFKLANFGDWIKILNTKTRWTRHTQYIKLQFTWLVDSISIAMYLYCSGAVASGALHCFPPSPPPSQLLSPRRGDSPQCSGGGGEAQTGGCSPQSPGPGDLMPPSPGLHTPTQRWASS